MVRTEKSGRAKIDVADRTNPFFFGWHIVKAWIFDQLAAEWLILAASIHDQPHDLDMQSIGI